MKFTLLTSQAHQPKLNHDKDSGWLTAALHLAHHKTSGHNVCSFATPECGKGCLDEAGQGAMIKTQLARQGRTHYFYTHRAKFMTALRQDLDKLVEQAHDLGKAPGCRLNGTSDQRWEVIKTDGKCLLDWYPTVMFYDYTKWPLAHRKGQIERPNGYLNFSWAETPDNQREAWAWLDHGLNVAVVLDTMTPNWNQPKVTLPTQWRGHRMIDGNHSDLRFLDPLGCFVGLTAKGNTARRWIKEGRTGDTHFIQPTEA